VALDGGLLGRRLGVLVLVLERVDQRLPRAGGAQRARELAARRELVRVLADDVLPRGDALVAAGLGGAGGGHRALELGIVLGHGLDRRGGGRTGGLGLLGRGRGL